MEMIMVKSQIGKLEFNLPEEDSDFKIAHASIKFYYLIKKIEWLIRNRETYWFEDTKEFYRDVLEEIKEQLLDFNGDEYA
jgi:hypothetical protein